MSFDFFRLFPVAGESLHALDTEQPPLEVKIGRHAIGELDALQRALVIEKLVAGHFGVAHRLIETMPSLKLLEAAVHPVRKTRPTDKTPDCRPPSDIDRSRCGDLVTLTLRPTPAGPDRFGRAPTYRLKLALSCIHQVTYSKKVKKWW